MGLVLSRDWYARSRRLVERRGKAERYSQHLQMVKVGFNQASMFRLQAPSITHLPRKALYEMEFICSAVFFLPFPQRTHSQIWTFESMYQISDNSSQFTPLPRQTSLWTLTACFTPEAERAPSERDHLPSGNQLAMGSLHDVESDPSHHRSALRQGIPKLLLKNFHVYEHMRSPRVIYRGNQKALETRKVKENVIFHIFSVRSAGDWRKYFHMVLETAVCLSPFPESGVISKTLLWGWEARARAKGSPDDWARPGGEGRGQPSAKPPPEHSASPLVLVIYGRRNK